VTSADERRLADIRQAIEARRREVGARERTDEFLVRLIGNLEARLRLLEGEKVVG
jgi:hypothetical protein